MEQKDKLFELVRVLNTNEKQWICKCFKLFNQKNNLTLFKYLEKQQSFDKEKMKHALKKTAFISYLAVQKNNLYNAILKYLRLYMENQGSQYELWNTLLDVTFLQERGLKSHCLDIIKKAQIYASEQEQHYPLLKLISLERDILSSSLYYTTSIKKLTDINNAYTSRLDLLRDIWEYRSWASQLSVLERDPQLFCPEEYQHILKGIKNFIETHQVSDNPVARYYYYQINLLYYIHIENYVKAFVYVEKQIEYLETVNINTANAKKNKLIIFVNSITVAFLARVEDDKMNPLLTKTHLLLKKEENLSFHNVLYNELYYNELNHYTYRNHLQKADKLVTEILEKAQTKILRLSPALMSSLSGHYFTMRAYDQAIIWNNKVLNQPKKNLLNVIHYNAIILKILLRIELDDIFCLESILQSLKRFSTNKKDFSNELTQVIYDFFKAFEHEAMSIKPNISTLCQNYCDKLSTKKLELRIHIRSFNLLQWMRTKF